MVEEQEINMKVDKSKRRMNNRIINVIIFNVLVYIPFLFRGDFIIILLLITFYLSPIINSTFLTKYIYKKYLIKRIKNRYIIVCLLSFTFIFVFVDIISSQLIIANKEITLYLYLLIFIKVIFYNIPFLNQLKSIVLVVLLSTFLFIVAIVSSYTNLKFLQYLIILLFVISSHFNIFISMNYFTPKNSFKL